MSTYNVKETSYPAQSRSKRRRELGQAYNGGSSSIVVVGGGGETPVIPPHDQLAGIVSTSDQYPDTARGIHLTAADADKLKTLLTAILNVISSTDTETLATDTNVFSALRTLNEIAEKALSKINDDTLNGLITLIKGFVSPGFTGGIIGDGFSLQPQKDAEGNFLSTWKLIIDYLDVTKKATFVEIEIDKITHVGGTIMLSPASMKCNKVEAITGGYRCFFDNSEKENTFVVGDQAICQVFSLPSTKRYWRYVMAVGLDYIDLSETDCEAGSDMPEAGDDIVQLGNRNNALRRGALILSSYGDAPSIAEYTDIGILYDGETSPYTLLNRQGTVIKPGDSEFTGKVTVKGGNGQKYRVPADRGAWASGTYYYYDRVSRNGSLWLCIASPTTTFEPTDANGAAWLKQVAQGAQGLPGSPGTPGAPGSPGLPSIVAILTNPFIGLPTTAAGVADFTNAYTSIRIYKGGVEQTEGVTYSFYPASTTALQYTVLGNKITFTAMPSDTGFIDCVATYLGVQYSQRVDIKRIKPGSNGVDAISYWFIAGAGAIIKTGTTYKPDPIYFYPRKQVGTGAAGAATGCVFRRLGLNSSQNWVSLASDVTIDAQLSFTQDVTDTYSAYKGQLLVGSNIVDEQTLYVIEDATSAKETIAQYLGFDNLAALANKSGKIDVGLLDAIMIVANGLVVEDIADVVGAQFLPEIVNIPQKNGLALTGTANGSPTDLNITPNPIESLATMLSTGAVSGTLQIPSASTGLFNWYPKTSGDKSVESGYQSIASGINSVRYAAIGINAQILVGTRESGDNAKGCSITVKSIVRFYNNTTLLSESVISQLSKTSSIQESQTISATIPTNVLAVPSGANRASIKLIFSAKSFHDINYVEPPLKLVFAATPTTAAAIFTNATGALKSQLGIDGYGITLDSYNFWHLKADSSGVLFSFKGRVSPGSHISGQLLFLNMGPRSSGDTNGVYSASGRLSSSYSITASSTNAAITVTHNYGSTNYHISWAPQQTYPCFYTVSAKTANAFTLTVYGFYGGTWSANLNPSLTILMESV